MFLAFFLPPSEQRIIKRRELVNNSIALSTPSIQSALDRVSSGQSLNRLRWNGIDTWMAISRNLSSKVNSQITYLNYVLQKTAAETPLFNLVKEDFTDTTLKGQACALASVATFLMLTGQTATAMLRTNWVEVVTGITTNLFVAARKMNKCAETLKVERPFEDDEIQQLIFKADAGSIRPQAQIVTSLLTLTRYDGNIPPAFLFSLADRLGPKHPFVEGCEELALALQNYTEGKK